MMLQKTCFAFQRFEYHISVEHDEKPPSTNCAGIDSGGPEI